jgi:hypothetical protein
MAAKKKKKRSLEQMQKVCQSCKKEQESTMQRTFYTKNYMGPCGDSFCYASCSMDTCHATTMVICDKCLKKLEKPKKVA